MRSLAEKGRLYTDDDGILLLVRKLTPPAPVCPDKPDGRGDLTRICVPLVMRLWIMQSCHANASCHLGVARTLCMPESFYWWIGKSVCTRWWLRR